MRAAVHRRFGGPDVVQVEDVPRPEVGAGDVLIHVHASTVSAADRRSRSKDVPRGLTLPTALTLGLHRTDPPRCSASRTVSASRRPASGAARWRGERRLGGC